VTIVKALSPRKVVVESVLFTTDRHLRGAIADLNNRNRAYCATGACRYLELNDLFSREELLRSDMTVDGVHLAGKAYPLWAARVRATGQEP
jgi:lysophospholipase L1-like esterase